ncbi:hypothetical protein [Candidatus Deianiraea vastatrix]|uniref:Uncharacterized protein n=1 Tax=Candidatus Deianiraea vastatrix TaxID=2163644 RepID=A0A5B8XEM1_9RICK|nr:hypothetical protein [Candidatus Deianiraea vastatrix]QED23713.1 hypothetical protein Deia_00926 [Candidatus Deianiraea vastatrix]
MPKIIQLNQQEDQISSDSSQQIQYDSSQQIQYDSSQQIQYDDQPMKVEKKQDNDDEINSEQSNNKQQNIYQSLTKNASKIYNCGYNNIFLDQSSEKQKSISLIDFSELQEKQSYVGSLQKEKNEESSIIPLSQN